MSFNRESLEKIVRGLFIDIFTHKNFDLVDSLFSKDAVIYAGKEKVEGRDKIKELITLRSHAIPDFQFTLEDILIDGNKVAIRWRATGHATKDVAGFKAGHSADYWGSSMWEINEDGRIHKDWYNSSTIDVF